MTHLKKICILSINLRPQEHPQWIPERDDPRFEQYLPQSPVESNPLWKTKAAYVYEEDTRLQFRMDQAKALTKTIVVDGLTPQVEVKKIGSDDWL